MLMLNLSASNMMFTCSRVLLTEDKHDAMLLPGETETCRQQNRTEQNFCSVDFLLINSGTMNNVLPVTSLFQNKSHLVLTSQKLLM